MGSFSVIDPGWPEERKGVPAPCHSQSIAHRGACGKARVVRQHRQPMPEPAEMGVTKCVWCSRRMGRAGTSNRWRELAVQLRTLGAEVRVCAPPDCAELLGNVGVPLVPIGVWR
jgi:vancomycin aglycone glucosyltransferase